MKKLELLSQTRLSEERLRQNLRGLFKYWVSCHIETELLDVFFKALSAPLLIYVSRGERRIEITDEHLLVRFMKMIRPMNRNLTLNQKMGQTGDFWEKKNAVVSF